jgi:bifunctional aspartokinase / homoserine dehydrogenase 1
MKVLKFGGSSVAKPERIQNIIQILKKGYFDKKIPFTVVFSAFGGVTDSLLDMSKRAENADASYMVLFEQFKSRHLESAKKLLSPEHFQDVLPVLEESGNALLNLLKGICLVREASTRTNDYVVSFGERASNFIIAHAMSAAGMPADFLDARCIIKTDKNFGAAKVNFEPTNALIAEHYKANPSIQVVTGFIASTMGGLTTTLGRGGSDYTAAILAAGLNAESIEIWTDVDGVLTADPRKVKQAFTIPTMTYAEAMEMSHFGAKVIYPPTLQPALAKKIPMYIKNTFNPQFLGTYISTQSDPHGHDIKGISSIGNISLLTLQGSGLFGTPGIAGRLFGALAAGGINVILITQGSSESSISWAVMPPDAKRSKRIVEKAFEFEMQNGSVDAIKTESDLAVVAVVGENMRYRPGIAGRLFHALGKNGVNCVAIAQGSSELNISVVINRENETKALNSLHEAFFLSDTKTLHIFMVGIGLIGSTLLSQIQKQAGFLRENRAIEIKIVGLSNTTKMVFENEGILLKKWKTVLDASTDGAILAQFVSKMKSMNLPNSIFIDCTADYAPANYYAEILEASISIVTPNKVANSSEYDKYLNLNQIARKRGVKFLYETNVGAGLPVISTLKDLMLSGDEILKIEGVLSGSLSFIFNNFKQNSVFSEIVKQAGVLGYTEPDPRIDLNGIDVRRKLIILARESGLAMEAADVTIHNILPESCQKAETVADFFEQLQLSDAYFNKMLQEAQAENCVLRMIAKIEGGKASIGLEKVSPQSPFYMLSGSDNMIVFTTERYRERPLVVRGPGAGAEVTAAGVFAEVITIGSM